MKIIFLKSIAMVAMVMCTFCGEAQVSKGMKLINGSAGFSSNGSKLEETINVSKSISSTLSVSPGGAYFLSDRVCLGVAFPFYYDVTKRTSETTSPSMDWKSFSTAYGINPFMRYYIPFNEKFYGYLQAGVAGNLTKSEGQTNGTTIGESKGFTIAPGANLGLTYFVSSKAAIEMQLIGVNYSYIHNERTVPNYKYATNSSSFNVNYFGSGLNLGISYYLK